MVLSPHSSYSKTNSEQPFASKKEGFVCCHKCKNMVQKEKTPFHAINNQNYVSAMPECLEILNEVELALLTPVKTYGFVFTYSGGKQENLKGTLTLMKVRERSITRAIAQLEVLGLCSHVIVCYTGKLTEKQKKRAREKCAVRTNKLLNAVKWLISNHKAWQNIDYNNVIKELQEVGPIIIDQSSQVQGEDSNIEEQELFSCYFPDGAINNNTAGLSNPEEFKQMVEKCQRKGLDVEFQLNLEKQLIFDSDEDNFVNACLLQFPYGIGGLNENRKKGNGSFTNSIDILEYTTHLSKLSESQFHHPIFVLLLYSMQVRQQILRTSRFQLNGKNASKDLVNGLNIEDLENTVWFRRNGKNDRGSCVSRKFLDSVNSTSKYVPHTNDAAKKARSQAESMQHHFGIGSYFLTVSFDDDNSLLMQILHGELLDKISPSSMTDEELKKISDERTKIRLKFLGLASIHFEMLLNIVLTKIIGWDITKEKPTKKPGLFGECEAVSLAVEEQGRRTLHAHIIIWIKGHQNIVSNLFSNNNEEARKATKMIVETADKVSTTNFFGEIRVNLRNSFDHDGCTIDSYALRQPPEVVTNQELRNLRHKDGYKNSGGTFAYCPHCLKTWTYEKLVEDYLKNYVRVPNLSKYPDTSTRRLEAMVIEHQKNGNGSSLLSTKVAHAAYNAHRSCHVKGCFRCNKNQAHKKTNKKRKQPSQNQNPKQVECRQRLPDAKRAKTTIRVINDSAPWYSWTGQKQPKNLYEIQPKRNYYDLFQNCSCSAVSESKLGCNSNLSVITPGPISQYQVKYETKGNQEEETAEFQEILKSMKVALCESERKYEADRPEALRLICRAAFAHNKNNIVGAPLASYLTRNGSRFICSHNFVFCPLQDLSILLRNGKVNHAIGLDTARNVFFQNSALHYLCRPLLLETMSVFDFYEKYYITSKKKKTPTNMLMHNTNFFNHPSFYENQMHQCVDERDEKRILQVTQWQFPDTAQFEGCLLDETKIPTQKMEEYSRLILILFFHFELKKT